MKSQAKKRSRVSVEQPVKYERPSSSELKQTQMKLILESPAPFVSSSHWCIVDRKKDRLLFGKRETEPRQVASLTKIMTATVVLDMVAQGEADLSS